MNKVKKTKIKKKNIRDEAVKYLPPKKRRRFAFTRYFFVYMIIFIGALIFTQALRSPLSSLMLVFVWILPLISLIYMLTALAGVKVFADGTSAETVKNRPFKFKVLIVNDFFLPYPFLEADIMLPNDDIVRCIEKRVGINLLPFSYYNFEEKISFKYRGEYNIGVSKIYIYDLFRMFRISMDVDEFTSVFVRPRRLNLESESKSAASDINTDSMKNIIGIDRSELNEIRDYRNGDHMKSIHWKLSSKTQELMVKEYAMNSGKTVYIFVDMAAHYDITNPIYSDDINEYMADGVIEIALAAALRELRSGNSCTMIWYDQRVESGAQVYPLQVPEDIEHIFRTFATVDLCNPTMRMLDLAALVEETQSVTMMFVTGSLDTDTIKGLSEIATLYGNISSQGAIELYHFSVAEKIIDKKEYEAFIDYEKSCCEQLIYNGIKVFESKF